MDRFRFANPTIGRDQGRFRPLAFSPAPRRCDAPVLALKTRGQTFYLTLLHLPAGADSVGVTVGLEFSGTQVNPRVGGELGHPRVELRRGAPVGRIAEGPRTFRSVRANGNPDLERLWIQ